MKRLVLLCGVAGSGKSTFIKLHNPYKDAHVLECDLYRKKVTGSFKIMPKDPYKEVYDVVIEAAKKLYEENKNVNIIIDSTFITKARRDYFVSRLPGFDSYELYILHTSDPKINLKKNKMRDPEKRVPENVVIDMWNKYEAPDDEEREFYDVINVIEVTE